ncbi:hypothetical protein RHSIM_Rhsim11G0104100 [Rhododendron simsii]|uniref:F-box domain-containing protein n=1 Tax=Rhododendron simsii TaxID=118357 RepID=A0A834G8J1_RHOSS|nr:hypothetical protein RHSIM_Rhsim11G0104100 [Rhododendron simsii]
MDFKFFIYSLGGQLWRKLDNFSYEPGALATTLDGALHWMVHPFRINDNDDIPFYSTFVMIFNMDTQEFCSKPHPGKGCLSLIEHRDMFIFEMKEKLALDLQLDDLCVDVWVLEDYEKWIWGKRHSVRPHLDVERYPRNFDYGNSYISLVDIQDDQLLFGWDFGDALSMTKKSTRRITMAYAPFGSFYEGSMVLECLTWIPCLWDKLICSLNISKDGFAVQDLPSEILVDILSRLPGDCVLECRRVCKQWLALTSTPNFVEMHLKRATPVLFMQRVDNNANKLDMFIFDEGAKANKMIKKMGAKLMHLEAPPHKPLLCGSCNGLLVFRPWFPSSLSFICNPLTREKITIQAPANPGIIFRIELPCFVSEEPPHLEYGATCRVVKSFCLKAYFGEVVNGKDDRCMDSGASKFKLQSSPPQYCPLSLVEEFILYRPILGNLEYSCASEYGVTFRSESYFQDPY